MSFIDINNMSFGLAIQKGLVNNFSGVQKFGLNTAVGSGAFETVWDGDNIYTYAPSSGTATATSSDTGSDNNGTVKIFGLDSNYDLAEETLTIGGSAGTVSFSRVFRALMVNANTGNTNVGTITVTVGATAMAQIDAGYGQTLMAVYTVPRNYRAYLINLDIGNSKDLELETIYRTKEVSNGNVWTTKAFITSRGGFVKKDFLLPSIINEKTDIEIRAKSSATSAVSAGFELVMEKILI